MIGPNALLPIIPVQFPFSSDADAAITAISTGSSLVLTAAHRPPWARNQRKWSYRLWS